MCLASSKHCSVIPRSLRQASVLSILLLLLIQASSSEDTNEADENTEEERVAPVIDYKEHLDVIFLFQKSGVSNSDLNSIQRFVAFNLHRLRTISPSDDHSRVAVVFFSRYVEDVFTFDDCCWEGRSGLQSRVYNEVDFSAMASAEDSEQKGDSFYNYKQSTPDSIDILNGFSYISEKYLATGLPRKKPTLVVFVLNFQTQYQNFQLFNEAFEQVEKSKLYGARIMTVIVDPQRKRIISRSQKTNLERYQPNLMAKLAELLPKNFEDSREPIALTSSYAKAFSSTKRIGLHIYSYPELNQPPCDTVIEHLITKPTGWFGGSEINSTCEDTKHLLEKQIWSPGFYAESKYVENVSCYWIITAPYGYNVKMTFLHIETEVYSDEVLVYDGNMEDEDQLIGRFSGNYPDEHLPSVTSTEDKLMVSFKSDDNFNGVGFLSTWSKPTAEQKITGMDVVYLADVSISIDPSEVKLARKWIKKSSKYFYTSIRKFPILNRKLSRVGLASFNDDCVILSSLGDGNTRKLFFDSVGTITHTTKSTFVGKALDVVRLQQFLKFREKMSWAELKKSNMTKILFIFSDVSSVDDIKLPAKRLCMSKILPVLITIGKVSEKGKRDLLSTCGVTFPITQPIIEVIKEIKRILGIKDLVEPPIDKVPASIPVNTHATRTSTTTTPPPTTRRTTTTPATTILPEPRKFRFLWLLAFLLGFGFLETLLIIISVCMYLTPYVSSSLRNDDPERNIDQVNSDDECVAAYSDFQEQNYCKSSNSHISLDSTTNSFWKRNVSDLEGMKSGF